MMKTNLRSYDNKGYHIGKGKIVVFLWFFVNSLIFQNPIVPFSKLKVFLLRLFGAEIGIGVRIKPSVNIKYPWKLTIGDFVWIGEKVWIDNLDYVDIGCNTCVSQGAMLLTGNHNYKKQTFELITKKIILEDGAWIGAKAIVCPGVKVSSHAVLTVGSIATKDLAPYTINQGNPAIKIKSRIIE